MGKPNCFQCRHYFVTWDQRMPRGCKLFDIKTALWPSQIVFQASGEECQDYEQKKGPPKKEGQIDFNDPKFWEKK